MFQDDDEPPVRPAWRRIGQPIAGIAAAGCVAWLGIQMLRHSSPAPRPHRDPPHIVSIKLPPPPPPPPIPPPPRPQTQEAVRQMPSPVKAATPKAPPHALAPPAAVTTSIQGAGNAGLGYSQGGGGDCLGAGCGNGDGNGSGGDQAAYFAGLIKSQIESALARDARLRFAHYRVTVSLLMDPRGHAVRASVRDFSGEADLAPEINRVLLNIATNEALPPDIVSHPVLLRINAHAPG